MNADCCRSSRAALSALRPALALVCVLGSPAWAATGAPVDTAASSDPEAPSFRTVRDRAEGAVSVDVPEGWQGRVAFHRIRPMAPSGPAAFEQIAVDIEVKNDAAGTVKVHRLPELLFFDPKRAQVDERVARSSRHLGMTVRERPSASEFLTGNAFPYAHGQADGLEVSETRPAPELAHEAKGRDPLHPLGPASEPEGAVVLVSYQERGKKYDERLVTVIEDVEGEPRGVWRNRHTYLVRAPSGELDRWAPTLSRIIHSITVDPDWLRRQTDQRLQRGQIPGATASDAERIAKETLERSERSRSQVHDALFPKLSASGAVPAD